MKSHDKIFPRLDMVRNMTSLLVIVRNPLDNFVSDLLDRNRVFVVRRTTAPPASKTPVFGRLFYSGCSNSVRRNTRSA